MSRMVDEINGWLLKKACLQLHVPHVNMFLDIDVTLDGKVLAHKHQRSKSFVRNAYNVMFSTVAGYDMSDVTFADSYLNKKDTSGNIRSGTGLVWGGCDAAGNGYQHVGSSNTYGIVVGTGTGAESLDSYQLGTIIAPGNGTGQLYTLRSELPVDSYGSLTMTRTLVRYFNNNSGSTIVLGEVGLIVKGYYSGDTWLAYLVSRDLISPTVNILDKAQLKVTYTINLVYPS